MIRGNRAWCKVPSESVIEALPLLRWSRVGERTAAGETAALMVYIALILMSDAESEEVPMLPLPAILRGSLPEPETPGTFTRSLQIAHATYDALQRATSLSRTLVAAGVARLVELELIKPVGSHQKRRYVIVAKGTSGGWFKLPSASIVRNQAIFPFANFTLRSKHELHALKLYLYLAARRTNSLEYTSVTYENIFERIHLSERDIRRAAGSLINCGLLRNVERESDAARKFYGPNMYFMTGSDRLRGADAGQAHTTPA